MPLASSGANITNSAQVNPGVIEGTDIATDAIDKTKIAADQVETSELADNAVESANIKDGEIVNADISASAGIVDTKLAEIGTANKLNGTAFKNLAGIPAGAGVIPAANLPAPVGDMVVYVPASAGFSSAAPITLDATNKLAYALMGNADNEKWYGTCKAPMGATGLSSIKIIFKSTGTGSTFGGRILTSKLNTDAEGAIVVDGTVTNFSLSEPGTTGHVQTTAVNADNFNGLSTIDQDDIIGFEVNRDGGGDASGSDMHFIGLLVTFS